MTATLITTGIEYVIGETDLDGSRIVRFCSTNVDLHHQLYLNGRLAAWTDTPGQRHFFLDEPVDAPVSVSIAAVDSAYRTTDLSGQLPADDRDPAWVFRPKIPRPVLSRIGDVVEILGDHAAGGDLSETPIGSSDAWPVWVPRWQFGEDCFGRGGFGYDGNYAPGLGKGAFGAGMFGMNADLIDIEAVLPEDGTHRLVLRSRGADGQVTDSDSIYIGANPLPDAAEGLAATNYDNQQKQLTLQINQGD
ncbi:MAG: hypothetical protein SVV80_12435 [Planctomycetota bacterium]|nr:hypothetical protein [Planctomycetota bacterium]